MGELLAEVGDLVFSIVIGYLGALEFFYVVRHLYHWTFRHPDAQETDLSNLQRLQDNIRNGLNESEAKENAAGINVMQDGVLYRDGFRVDPPHEEEEIAQLRARLSTKDEQDKRRKQIEAELVRQKRIEEETRKQLEEAEAELERQRQERAAAEEEERNALLVLRAEEKERQRQQEIEKLEEQKEKEANERKLLAISKELEEKEKRREEQEHFVMIKRREAAEQRENENKLLSTEKEREEKEREQDEEEEALNELKNEKKLLISEKEREETEERLTTRQELKAIKDQDEKEEEEMRKSGHNEEKLWATEKNLTEKYREREEWEEAEIENEQRRLEKARNARLAQFEIEAERETTKGNEQPKAQVKEITEGRRKEGREEAEETEKLLAAERDSEDAEQQGGDDYYRNKEANTEQALLLLEAEREYERQQRETEESNDECKRKLQTSEGLIIDKAHFRSEGPLELPEPEDSQEEGQKDSLRKLLEAETEYELQQQQQEQIEEQLEADMLEKKRKQKIKEENARKFLEAEQEMVELQRQMAEAVQKRHDAPLTQQISVVEEPCVRKDIKPLYEPDRMTQSVKTQFGQAASEAYSLSSKPLLFPNVAEDTPALEPGTLSTQSSLRTQLSEEDTKPSESVLGLLEREEPDGEDTTPPIHYTDEYLRSLDGIKPRPLMREDGSGRRRAFKKRRSSGSSSSRDSRTSREEEIKMFTSLEEEEMKGGDDSTAIKYTSERTLKVKGHHRRHKRSPAQDAKHSEESLKTSLEMLDEESTNPWGEVVPEHYKDTEFWKREKATSIDEEDDIDVGKAAIEQAKQGEAITADQIPNTSSFEEANETQHKAALIALKSVQGSQRTKTDDQEDLDTSNVSTNGKNPNLHTSPNTEGSSSPASSTSPHLRRSPRIEELDQYKELEGDEKGFESNQKPFSTSTTPSIKIEGAAAANESWRDEYGLLVQGISDFYDFTASVNPSRSRSTSRNVSRSTTPHSKSKSNSNLKNVSYNGTNRGITDIYDDTRDSSGEIPVSKEMLIEVIDQSNRGDGGGGGGGGGGGFPHKLEYIADDPRERRSDNENMPPGLSHSDRTDANADDYEVSRKTIISLVESLRAGGSESPSSERSLLADAADQTDHKSGCKMNDKSRKEMGEYSLMTSGSSDHAPVESPPATEDSKEDMNSLIQSLRAERCTSRSRSRSPLPTADNVQRSLETRRSKRIQQNDELFEKINQGQSPSQSNHDTISYCNEVTPPAILVETVEDSHKEDEQNLTTDDMAGLVESLRIARANSRSRSKSPMRIPTETNLRRSVEVRRNRLIQQNDELLAQLATRSQTPESVESLGKQEGQEVSAASLLVKAPTNISFNNEDRIQTFVLEKTIDDKALKQIRVATTETQLRTESEEPIHQLYAPETANGITPNLDGSNALYKDRLKKLKCSPTTPEYDRSISVEWKDVQRIKEEILASGFKRSTYVGESMDLGSEYEELRRITAHFKRSPSRSRSIPEDEMAVELARRKASEARQIQEEILAEITTSSRDNSQHEDRHGAKPKTDFKKKSTPTNSRKHVKSDVTGYGDYDEDLADEYAEMRRSAAEFRRSQSKSRSPIEAQDSQALTAIDAEAARRGLQDQILDEIEQTTMHFQDFTRDLNVEFLDHERRASDSAIIQKPEVIIQFQDNDTDTDLDLDPEEYHHFRRYSLHQDLSQEEYPNDDYICVSQIEVRTVSGVRTWTREDFYSEDFGPRSSPMPDIAAIAKTPDSLEEVHDIVEHLLEEEETDGSEDDRRTVVDVEDEIEEDLNDFHERGAADESQHEQSECEEAERELDRYADRRAIDWKDLVVSDDCGGAMGGAKDTDSFAIDEIYNEAIRNRKQSGILRDFDNILQSMQQNYEDNGTGEISPQKLGDSEPQSHKNHDFIIKMKSRHLGSNSSLNSIESERRDGEWRYLGDATTNARNSARLRSRYGYAPVPRTNPVEEIEVDLNYKPKREYNWRKNFKLEEEERQESDERQQERMERSDDKITEEDGTVMDARESHKLSIGGDSTSTLVSRGSDIEHWREDDAEETEAREVLVEQETNSGLTVTEFATETKASNDIQEKPKKKKGKRKIRKGSMVECADNATREEEKGRDPAIVDQNDEMKDENDSPKRKSRSSRSSKSNLLNEDSLSVYSPGGSIDYPEPMEGFTGEYTETVAAQKKKSKKKRKGKETSMLQQSEIAEEVNVVVAAAPTNELNIAGGLVTAPQTVQPATVEATAKTEEKTVPPPAPATASATSRVLDSLDILKDGNFYPLF